MCFSAEASFIGAGVVGGIGIATLTQLRRPREILYGALPLAFAVHQLLEGITWTEVCGTPGLVLSGWSVHLWVIYAWALLPLWVPLAVWLIEPSKKRRRWLIPFIVVGIGELAMMMMGALHDTIDVQIVDSNLDYVYPYVNTPWSIGPYILTTCISGLLSSFKWVRYFAIANIIALSAAGLIRLADFSSLWCTFAAFLSFMVLLHFIVIRRAARRGVHATAA